MIQEILNRTLHNIARELQGGIQECLNLVAKEMADPAEILNLLKGVNIGAFGGPAGIASQSGFDPYLVLGVERSATDDEVKKAYYDMMVRLHPDKVGRDTSFLAAIVNLAYQQIQIERGKARM